MTNYTNNRQVKYGWPLLLLIAGIFFLIGVILPNYLFKSKSIEPNILRNDNYIRGLFKKIDLSDQDALFEYVFNNLDPQVTVFPTENFFYINVFANGRELKCCIHLEADKLDNGMVSFGYHEQIDKTKTREISSIGVAGGREYTLEHGVEVKKISPMKYSISYQGKTVVFVLNDIKAAKPKNQILMPFEKYIGPCFDESGLAFHLIFNENTKHLFWILNEDQFVPEIFHPWKGQVLLGNRTDFAFYNDTINGRKILIGANFYNVINNNWYDGPFDQMPDNYVKNNIIEVQPYLEEAYPYYKGRLDKYGNFIDQKNSRIPVGNYYVYHSVDDLSFVEECGSSSSDLSNFYTCITQQVYKVPKDFY